MAFRPRQLSITAQTAFESRILGRSKSIFDVDMPKHSLCESIDSVVILREAADSHRARQWSLGAPARDGGSKV